MSEPVFDSDTPLSKGRASGYQACSLGAADDGRANLNQYRAELADDMAHTAVLADLDKFCDKYFPDNPDNPRPKIKKNPFKTIKKLKKVKGNETIIRQEFTKAVTDNNLIPGLVFRDCGNRPAGLHIDSYRQKVDAAWYYPRDAPADGTPEWGGQVIPVEFKGDETGGDPYNEEDEDNISAEAATRKEARGQMTTYSELLHGIQQRTAVFMLMIIGRQARFTRWDRSGTVVTKAINYTKQWELFCDTLWRISHCSQTQLGFDPTATRIYEGDPDWDAMVQAASTATKTVDHTERQLSSEVLPEGEFEYVRQMFEDSLVPGWPRYRVKVPDEVPGEATTESEKKYRDFLIAKPAFRAKGMVGRGTRGYVALDCKTKRFRWLKDAWRSDYELVEREGEILASLNKARVVNVPTMFCHGDVGDQKTETPDWWELRNSDPGDDSEASPVPDVFGSEHTLVDPSSSKGKKRQREEEEDMESWPELESCPLRLHRHYRLVVKEVAMPLDRFETPRQLVQVVFDCAIAHEQAAKMPERPLLHRDISSGNMLMYPRLDTDEDEKPVLRWSGMLADWELSKPFQRDDSEVRSARQPVRTGTWQYLSVALLSPGVLRVGIADEVESFFHVLLYYALRYVKSTNCSGLTVANFLDQYFDLFGYEDSLYTCGHMKRSTIERGILRIGAKTHIKFNNPLDSLFAKLMSWFKARYIIQSYEEEVEAAKKQAEAAAPGSPKKKKLFGGTLKALAGRALLEEEEKTEAKPPDDKVRALAEKLKSHDGLVLALFGALNGEWPEQRAEDQIPSGWKPMTGRFPQRRADENKRRRTARVPPASAPPMFPVVLRPPKTPQRRAVHSMGVGRNNKPS